jgi:phosphate transport system substrate-binding protein
LKHRKSFGWLFALVAVMAVFASACGSSDSSKSTTTVKSTTTLNAANAALAKLSGTVDGGGSSFQDTFQQQVSSDFGKAVTAAGGSATVTYTKSGSTDGKKGLADKSLDFAGSDSAIKPEETAAFGSRKILFFPLVGGPISVPFNIKGVSKLNLSPDVLAGIFQAQITTWNDPKIAADNAGVTLPSTKITVVHRSDGSGTTSNFTKYLVKAAPNTWKLDKGETVNWPASTQGAEKSSGVTAVIKSTDGAIGYADLADAAKENLDVASIGNAKGKFIAPTPGSASIALAAAPVAADLTFDSLNVDAPGAYPITSGTYILVDQAQTDAANGAIIKAYLTYVLTTGQQQAKGLLYAPLPASITKKALAQIAQITVG